MARITVEDCIDKFESRFELVLVASNRARKIHSGDDPTIEKDNDKPTVIALREIANESIPIDNLKENLIQEYQIVSPLDEEELSLDYTVEENALKEDNDIYHDKDEIQFSKENKENEEINIPSNVNEVEQDNALSKNEGYSDISDDNNS